MILYHFTCPCPDHLGSILKDGVLRPSNANVLSAQRRVLSAGGDHYRVVGAHGVPDVVWLLDTPTCTDYSHGLKASPEFEKYVRRTGHRLADDDKQRIRFTVDVSAKRWLDWLKTQRHDPHHVRGIIATGGGIAAARHWFVTRQPIPSSEWIEVRDMHTGKVIDTRQEVPA